MERGNFMGIVGAHYKDIRNLFICRVKKLGRPFSDDSFNTAFIKCAERFGDKEVGYDDVVRYFYVSYLNTELKNDKMKERFELCDEFDDILDDDQSFATTLYDKVMDAVKDTFNENDMMVYSLYKYHGWTKEDLENDGYDCANLDIRVNTIHRFVKTYCRKKFK
jgi:hypothetical protein